MNGRINTEFYIQSRVVYIPADDWRYFPPGQLHGRRGPKEPIILVVVPFAVLNNASFIYSELNITIPENSFDIVARVPAENPIRAIVCD
jgi:hypothetical protein